MARGSEPAPDTASVGRSAGGASFSRRVFPLLPGTIREQNPNEVPRGFLEGPTWRGRHRPYAATELLLGIPLEDSHPGSHILADVAFSSLIDSIWTT